MQGLLQSLRVLGLLLGLAGGVWAMDATDISSPDRSGYTPAEMAAWFNDRTKSPVTSSGEQVALIWQLCSRCRALIEQSGGDNYGMIYQNVDDSYATIIQLGNGHQGIVQAGGGPSYASIWQAPGTIGNIATINQSGGAAAVASATWR
jgi:hypothetical protein